MMKATIVGNLLESPGCVMNFFRLAFEQDAKNWFHRSKINASIVARSYAISS